MAKLSIDQVDQFSNQTGSNKFFGIGEDKETKKVRFLLNDANDLDIHFVHDVEVNGSTKKHVDCLRTSSSDPIDKCPFCAAKKWGGTKVFIPVYDLTDNEVRIWERGPKFIAKMQSLATRYNPLVSTIIEIERNGKKGDTQTTYEMYPLETDKSVTLETLPEKLNLDWLVLQKSAADMQYFLDMEAKTGIADFPEEDKSKGVTPRPETTTQTTTASAETPKRGTEVF